MRFSSVFQRPRPQPAAHEEALHAEPPVPAAAPAAAPCAPPPQDMPEELDARVRLVGEWQLGEG